MDATTTLTATGDIANEPEATRATRAPRQPRAAKQTGVARSAREVRKDPGKHYVLVERDDVEEYLDKLSPTDPSVGMYQIDSEERRETGHRNLVRLSCSVEDYNAMMKEIEADSMHKQTITAHDETFTQGASVLKA